MKKIEEDFLKAFADSKDFSNLNSISYDEIKEEINIERFYYKKTKNWIRWLTFALSLVFVFSILGGYIHAKEEKKYQQAVDFFDHYQLIKDNLSRKEIKNIYHDIINNSFTYHKTAQVVSISFKKYVTSYEATSGDLTPEEILHLWQYIKKQKETKEVSIRYNHYSHFINDIERGSDDYYEHVTVYCDKSYFEKYDGTVLLWKREFDNYYISNYKVVGNVIILYGHNSDYGTTNYRQLWITSINQNGETLWSKEIDNGDKRENVEYIIDNGDNSFVVMTIADTDELGIIEMDASGNVLQYNSLEVGNYHIQNAARLDGGYLVQLSSYNKSPKIIYINEDGSVEETFYFQAEDKLYFIADMIEYNQKIYISAYSVPTIKKGSNNYGTRIEIASVLNYLHENKITDISSEELTPIVKGIYTALLYACDGDLPTEVYSVAGAIGSKLSLSETGELLWNLESVTSTFYSPASNSFTIGGISKIYQYSFDYDGDFIWKKDTGEITIYRR